MNFIRQGKTSLPVKANQMNTFCCNFFSIGRFEALASRLKPESFLGLLILIFPMFSKFTDGSTTITCNACPANKQQPDAGSYLQSPKWYSPCNPSRHDGRPKRYSRYYKRSSQIRHRMNRKRKSVAIFAFALH